MASGVNKCLLGSSLAVYVLSGRQERAGGQGVVRRGQGCCALGLSDKQVDTSDDHDGMTIRVIIRSCLSRQSCAADNRKYPVVVSPMETGV